MQSLLRPTRQKYCYRNHKSHHHANRWTETNILTVHKLQAIVINTACMHTDSNWSLSTERLDSAYGWLPWPDTLPPAPVGLLPDPCQPLKGTPLDGCIALVLLSDDWHEKPCSAAQIVRSAQVGESLSFVSTGCPGVLWKVFCMRSDGLSLQMQLMQAGVARDVCSFQRVTCPLLHLVTLHLLSVLPYCP